MRTQRLLSLDQINTKHMLSRKTGTEGFCHHLKLGSSCDPGSEFWSGLSQFCDCRGRAHRCLLSLMTQASAAVSSRGGQSPMSTLAQDPGSINVSFLPSIQNYKFWIVVWDYILILPEDMDSYKVNRYLTQCYTRVLEACQYLLKQILHKSCID